MFSHQGLFIMPAPQTPWTILEGFSCLGIWTALEWKQFQRLVEDMEKFGKAGGMDPGAIALASTVPCFVFQYGTNLIYRVANSDQTFSLTIPPGRKPGEYHQLLAERHVNSAEIPTVMNMTLQKITPDSPWGQMLGCNQVNAENTIIAIDPYTLYYPYLGPSNFAHELGHALTKSADEDFPRLCEEAVLLGALKTEPVENHDFIEELLRQLHERMGKS